MTVQLAIARLARTAQFSPSEQNALLDVCSGPKRFEARRELLCEGAPPAATFLLLSGIAGRFVSSPDGHPKCAAYLLPGDLFGRRALVWHPMDHSVRTLSMVDAMVISRDALDRLATRLPNLAKGFMRLSAIEAAISRQWLLNVGHRSSLAALAHLFCEIFERLRSGGETTQNSCRLPFTQADLADALAITPVHLNRTLMKLRRSGLAELHDGQLTITDAAGLKAVAHFDPLYLSEAPTAPLTLTPSREPDERGTVPIRRNDSPYPPLTR